MLNGPNCPIHHCSAIIPANNQSHDQHNSTKVQLWYSMPISSVCAVLSDMRGFLALVCGDMPLGGAAQALVEEAARGGAEHAPGALIGMQAVRRHDEALPLADPVPRQPAEEE